MNVYSVSRKFHTQIDCIKYLESLRWGKKPVCTYCHSTNTVPIEHGARHHCNDCKRSFSVMVGAIFEGARLPLPQFFSLIALMLHARGGISAKQLSRNVGIGYKSAWFAAMRARCAMVETIDNLKGIVETDETYLTPKKKIKRKIPTNDAAYSQINTEKPKRGHGTNKILVSGWTERDGRLIMKVLKNLKTETLLTLLKKYVQEENTTLMTDDLRSYQAFDDVIDRESVNHSKKEYARGNAHTNTIEGIWQVVKGGLRGQFRVLSEKYLPFYLAEFAYKFNRRNLPSLQFEAFMEDALSEKKCMLCYHPVKDVKKIVYPRAKKKKAFERKFNAANKEAGKKRAAKAKRTKTRTKKRWTEHKKALAKLPKKKVQTKPEAKKVWRTATPKSALGKRK